jgi:hypothetical protein
MEQHLHNQSITPASVNENFDCNKMKSLLGDNTHRSFSERFSNWINHYTKSKREKIWMDIEYYRSK